MTNTPQTDPHADFAGSSLWADAGRRLRKNRAAVLGGAIVLGMALAALLFPVLSRYGTRYTHDETHVCLRYQPPGARGVPRVYQQLDNIPIAQVDFDQSGTVGSAELSTYVQQREFDRLDRNDDGALDLREFERAPRVWLSRTHAEALAAFDTNGDGRLQLDESAELTDIFPDGESGLFLRARDANQDGQLDANEYDGVPRTRTFVLGTDGLGRDVLTRLIYGARISLAVGLLATLVSFFIGVTWGAVAGYVGGRVDAVMMRIVDIIYGLPFMFLVILLMVVFGRNILLLFVAIGAVEWLTMSRIVRGQVISLKNQEFVLAARGIGTPMHQIVFRHLIPNALGPIIVYATLTVPAVMLTEAFLSFLGLGVQAPATSWGAMASEGAAPGIMLSYPWMILGPGIALAVTLLSLNFLGDGLRDALDPRMRKD